MTDISRLDTMVPGLQFASSGNEVRLALRGTRQNNVGTEGEQAVGIFEDGVYVPTSTQAMGSYLDINRIEVLRGPQGTLYGRNTFGGTINIVTNDPDPSDFYGNVEALYGDYDRIKLQGVVNIPVTENFALRLAALSDEHDGYIVNTWIPGPSDDLNDRDDTVVRASLLWNITDNFTAKFKATINDRKSNGSAIWGYQQIGGYVDGELLPGPPRSHRRMLPTISIRAHGSSRVTRRVTGTSTTASIHWTWHGISPISQPSNSSATRPKWMGNRITTRTTPMAASSENNGFTGWRIFPGHLVHRTAIGVQYRWPCRLDAGLCTTMTRPPTGIGWNWWTASLRSAALGRSGRLPVRFLRRFRQCHLPRQRRSAPARRSALCRRQQEATRPTRLECSGHLCPYPAAVVRGNGTRTLWKAGVEYDLNDDMMTYFTASTGYRAGGINVVGEDIPPTYDPEEVLAWEIGLKSTLLDGAMTMNVAAYYNDFSDMQAQSFGTTPGSVNVFEFTENGGAVDVKGIEVEMNWVPGGDSNWKHCAHSLPI